jgi:phage baseplate assembly protein W
MQAVRYRTGIDRTTGKTLVGWAHVQQSLAIIWTTRLTERVMRLTFGSTLRSWLAEDLNPTTALGIYTELVVATHTWEPEYRISTLQFVDATRAGGLGVRHSGTYYPEGRLGNYGLAIPIGVGAPIVVRETLARRIA